GIERRRAIVASARCGYNRRARTARSVRRVGVSSMTGFARAEGEADGISWVWELKSVNSRSLDLRLRLPPGFDALEPQLRGALARVIRRGNIAATLSVNRLVPPSIRVNRQMLAQIVTLLGDLSDE